MPQILIDGSVYTFAPSGGAYHFLNGLLARLPKDSTFDFRLITVGENERARKNAGVAQLANPLPSVSLPDGWIKDILRPVKRRFDLYFQRGRQAKGPAIFHSIYYYPCPDPKIPMLTMVHDLIPEKFPNLYSKDLTAAFCLEKQKCIEKSARYICISECTKRDLMEFYQVNDEDIDVVPHAVDTAIFHPNGEAYESDEPYFLHVGGRLHHKNFERLVIAFAESPLSKDFQLITSGMAWAPQELELIKKLGVANRVRLIQSPTSQELAKLYRGSAGFVFPSLYEGFGIPLIEAMACGAPVIASKAGPFAEVAGEAALYFDPLSPSTIAERMEEATVPKVKTELIRRGFERAQHYNWDRTIKGTMGSYERLLRRSSSAS